MAERDLIVPIPMTVGDRAPAREWIVRDRNGDPVDTTGWVLTPGSAVTYVRFQNVHDDSVIEGNGTVAWNADRRTGRLTYTWGTADTATAGTYVIRVRFDTTGAGVYFATMRDRRRLVVEAMPTLPSP